MTETPNYVYSAEPKRGEDFGLFEQGPYIIVRVYASGEHAAVTDEPEHEHSPDAWARACKLNREQIGIDEQATNKFVRAAYWAADKHRIMEVKRVEAARQAAEQAERERKKAIDIARGAPQGRSPADVAQDKNYEHVADISVNSYPSSIQCVVRHKSMTHSCGRCRAILELTIFLNAVIRDYLNHYASPGSVPSSGGDEEEQENEPVEAEQTSAGEASGSAGFRYQREDRRW